MNSIIPYPVDATTTFSLPFVGGVLHKDHVQAWVLKGDLTEEQVPLDGAVWMPAVGTPTSVTLAAPVNTIEDAVTLEFRRVTPRTPLVDFTLRGRLTEHNLDIATKQSTLIAGEMEDTVTGDIVENAQEMLEQLIAFTINELGEEFDDEVAASAASAASASASAAAAEGFKDDAEAAAASAASDVSASLTASVQALVDEAEGFKDDAEAAADSAAADVSATLTAAVAASASAASGSASAAASSASAAAGSASTASTQATNAANSATAAATSASNAALYGGVGLQTSQATTSGTSKTWAVPSGVTRITVMIDRVSCSADFELGIRLGSGGSLQTTGYTVVSGVYGSSTPSVADYTSGFVTRQVGNAGTMTGVLTLTRLAAGSDIWLGTGSFRDATTRVHQVTGVAVISATTNIVGVAIVSGTAFDAGTVNVAFEY